MNEYLDIFMILTSVNLLRKFGNNLPFYITFCVELFFCSPIVLEHDFLKLSYEYWDELFPAKTKSIKLCIASLVCVIIYLFTFYVTLCSFISLWKNDPGHSSHSLKKYNMMRAFLVNPMYIPDMYVSFLKWNHFFQITLFPKLVTYILIQVAISI